jgi:S-layer protein (TIGR01567 family)
MKKRVCLGLSLIMVFSTLVLVNGIMAQQPEESAFVRGHFSEGNGIWRAEDFDWFYYDSDKGVGGEQLSVNLTGRLAEKGDIVYSSRVWSNEFEYRPWGSYNAVAFMGKRYLAGYPDSSFTDAVSIMGTGALLEVLADTKETYIIAYNQSMPLRNGYSLVIGNLSKNDDEAPLFLYKNQKLMHWAIVSTGDTFVYKIGNVPIILAHLSEVMRGVDYGAAEVDGVFQVSDIPNIRMSEGNKLGNMDVTHLSEDLLELSNNNSLSLTQNSVVPLAYTPDQMLLDLTVLDTPNLIYYPQGGIFDYGIHEIRGPVYTQDTSLPIENPIIKANSAKALWDYSNFTGFYLDPEKNLGREQLAVYRLSGRSIPPLQRDIVDNSQEVLPPGLWYNTPLQTTQFKYRPWGYYNVTALFGELWFAGYGPKTSREIGNIDTMQNFRIIQLIQDSDDILKLNSGKALILGEGYEFGLISVNEDKAAVVLSKNGEIIDTDVLKSDSTYLYKKDLADFKDLPIIALHIQNVFSDGKNQTVMIDGLFQISDRGYLPVEPGQKFDNMAIYYFSPGNITMINLEDSINLGRDTTDSVLPGIYIRSADNDSLRYYLYTLKYVVPAPKLARDINLTKNVPALGQANFSMIVKAGDIVRVSAEISDSDGRMVNYRDLTNFGLGSEDLWGYFWQWNASALKLSDDGSPIMDSNGGSIPGLLYLNSSSQPAQVGIRFDDSGRISSIADSQEIYYISRTDYNLTKPNISYDAMMLNSTARKQYIKINLGSSQLKFYDNIGDQFSPGKSNHTLNGSLDSLEPHAIRVAANPGKYELTVRIENVANALRINGSFFNITAPEMRGVLIGSNTTQAGKLTTVKLEVPNSDVEKSVVVSYNPDQITAISASGPCNTSSHIDQKSGQIKVAFPPGCGSINLTFLGGQKNATSALQIEKAEGFVPDKIINGSVAVTANRSVEQISAPAFIVAIISLAAAAARRKK